MLGLLIRPKVCACLPIGLTFRNWQRLKAVPPTDDHNESGLGRVLRRVGLINRDSSKGLAKQLLWIAFAALVVVVLVSPWGGSPGGLGIKGNETIKIERDKNKQIVKYLIERDEGKTVWDWIGLIGVPVTLAFLGIWFQDGQQKRADQEVKEQRELAAEQNKEEILQRYLDRAAKLLVENDIIHLSEQKAGKSTVAAAATIIRAMTLSVLRSFANDGKRKGSVVSFLIETTVLRKLELSLDHSDLSWADLAHANLGKCTLDFADLSHADLRYALLPGASLLKAKLVSTNLEYAYLVGADLRCADLSDTILIHADLQDVIWDCITEWPGPAHFDHAKNVPAELKSKLGLP